MAKNDWMQEQESTMDYLRKTLEEIASGKMELGKELTELIEAEDRAKTETLEDIRRTDGPIKEQPNELDSLNSERTAKK